MEMSKDLQWFIDNDITISVMYTSRESKLWIVVSVYSDGVKTFEDAKAEVAIRKAYNYYKEIHNEQD